MTTGIEFYFDPDRKGIAVFLGPAQARLMEIAWRHGYVTAKMGTHQTGEKRKRSYSAIGPVLALLCGKKFLKRKKIGRAVKYFPVTSRKQFIKIRVVKIEKCLKANFRKI